MSRLVHLLRRSLFVLAVVSATACNPSRPTAGDGDASPADPPDTGVPDAPDAGPDGPPPPPAPGTAMETVIGGGRATAGTLSIDVQLGGGLPGATSSTGETVRPAPALP
jgi:hypothetical protein